MRALTTITFAASLLALSAGVTGAGEDPAAAKPGASEAIAKAEANKWLKLHEQKGGDAVRFKRQAHGGSCIWELSGEPRVWQKLPGRSMFGWHNNMAYDSKSKAMVIFGTNKNSNDIVVYNATTKEHKKMPTAGKRPAEDQHNPMCFDTRAGATVIVVDRVEGDLKDRKAPRKGETWLYDLGADAWTQLPEATLPFGCGMNYNMEYDPKDGACLLVEQGRGKQTTVWALKVDRAKLGK